MKVLVADDDPTSLRLLEHVLPRFGHEPVSARDGGEAWEALQAPGAPRVAILDWMMPVLDGLGVCRRLRTEAGIPYVYVILLSARGQREDIATGLGAGADAYLVKPCSHLQLRDSLAAAEMAVKARDAGA